MIIWLNGTFGVGKTTTSSLLLDRSPDWRMFDPERVGYALSALAKRRKVDDFQDLALWRHLVPVVLRARSLRGMHLVAPQSVLVENYWDELRTGMARLGLDVFHVLLDCSDAELRSRIEADEIERDAQQWRLDHLDQYQAALPWISAAADLVIDTTEAAPATVVDRILAAL